MSPHRLHLLALILLLLWLGMLLLGGPGSAADPALLSLFRFPALVPAARAVTQLGNWTFLVPVGAVAAALLAWRVSKRSALVYAAMLIGERLLVELQKAMIGRDRPPPVGRLVETTSLAFPSAHSANSMTAWLGLALLAAPARYRPAAVAIAVSVAILVGLSRLVLAVHWPSDVIGGWAFGAGWVLLCARLAEGTPLPARH
jgi:membrane-associated phospholipid phosphatase